MRMIILILFRVHGKKIRTDAKNAVYGYCQYVDTFSYILLRHQKKGYKLMITSTLWNQRNKRVA